MAMYWEIQWAIKGLDLILRIYPGGSGDFDFATATKVGLRRGALVDAKVKWEYDTLAVGMPQLPRLELEFDIRRTDNQLLQLLLQPEVPLDSGFWGGAVVRLEALMHDTAEIEPIGEYVIMKGATYTGKTLKIFAEHAYSVAMQYVDLRDHTLGQEDAHTRAFRLYAVRDSQGEVYFYDKEPDGVTNFWLIPLTQWHQHLETKARSLYQALVRRSSGAFTLGQFEQEFKFYKQTATPNGAIGNQLNSVDVEFVAFSYSKTGALDHGHGLLKNYGSMYDYLSDWAEVGLLRWWSWQDVGINYSPFWSQFRFVELGAKDVMKAEVKLYDLIISGVVVSLYDQLEKGINKVERTVRYGTQSKQQYQVPVWFHTMPPVVDYDKKGLNYSNYTKYARAGVLLSSNLYYRDTQILDHYDMMRVHEFVDLYLGAGKYLSDFVPFTPFDRSGLDYWNPETMLQIAEHSFPVYLADLLRRIFENRFTTLEIEVFLYKLISNGMSLRNIWAVPGQVVRLPLQQIDSFLPPVEQFVMVGCEADIGSGRAKVQLVEQAIL